ncbi:hypothetical protein A2348_01870 [Candidatus Uhrbacteria bacterium RIFOXYB12_FULL_58_10]|uniref:UPF0235 protein A2304_04770 n=1 Tax=Candidatus Uhrbacteria bacterium RIFOXYB2_FULL_57_15 TaxID=1802422 RepID=A0A1F7W4X3_9BACT|nr:MAG: hypothetical protein A2348_01870 [Candidatus Uhrbacteria bacterium RIFOXYB12_FULL_58_10]OGL97865.1 MAG: hypothetical protein A2304_04770 [Candidatus Uhrbacteria bacterium RIFOXYB2_FULL_57_15]OGM00474.1 MAG: hypothetical protein A2501_00740 [Candidatus Uhrbacteria bacterium RIFOXYC12_FULL_57_11]
MIVTIHAKPGARKNEIVWLDENTAKASVTAPPERGKANEAIIGLVAEHYNVSKSCVRLVRGATTRVKQLSIDV